jgi:RimJ/RimL family protein N-acetyltransferase
VQLLPLSQRDIATILRWNMGRDANWLYQWAGKGWPLTAAQIAGKLAPESQVFRIDHDGEMIGTVELAGFTADSASICRFLIDTPWRGRGIGTAALAMLCDHVFTTLNLKRLDLRVFDFNAAAMACYRKGGFTEVQRQPDAWRDRSRECSVVVMAKAGPNQPAR